MQKQHGQGRDREKHDETKAKVLRSELFKAPRRSASSDGKMRCRKHRGRRHQGRERETDIAFLIGQSTVPDSKFAAALEEYRAAVARSEATKVSLEDQAQMAAAAETEVQQAQQTISQVESEAAKDAANVEQAVRAQEDAEAGEAAVSSKTASAREPRERS